MTGKNREILEHQIKILEHLKNEGAVKRVSKILGNEKEIFGGTASLVSLNFEDYEYSIIEKIGDKLCFENASFLLACPVKHLKNNLKLLVTGLDEECIHCSSHKFKYEFFQTNFTFLDGSSIMPI